MSEILRLRWQEVDFKNKLIYIVDSKNKEKREVPINDPLFKVLKDLKQTSNSDYVFSHSDGSPIGKVCKGFTSACRRAGIENSKSPQIINR